MSRIPVRSVLTTLSIIGIAGLASAIYASFRLQPNHTSRAPEQVCETIATDPDPPLKVRSSPVVAPDNVVGSVKNGTVLAVVDENKGWLRIQTPLKGWVYKERTATSCIPNIRLSPTTSPDQIGIQQSQGDEAARLMAAATEQYQAGNLNAAIALVNSIPTDHVLHKSATENVLQWQKDWKTAEAAFFSAQKALREGQPAAVLEKVKNFPENRYWKERMTPLVESAIQQQNNQSQSPPTKVN